MFITYGFDYFIESVDLANINPAVMECSAELLLCALLDNWEVCCWGFVEVKGVYWDEISSALKKWRTKE